jgi:hypothetical protein
LRAIEKAKRYQQQKAIKTAPSLDWIPKSECPSEGTVLVLPNGNTQLIHQAINRSSKVLDHLVFT